MTLQAGRMLAHYRLVEQIGEGGMGVVWKALDTDLDREVAIKVLPEHFAADSQRLARFEREAKLLASLNHGHIAAIYGLHQADGIRFLAMELVPGQSLDARLAQGPLPLQDALRLALDVAGALEAAHENGVIHRDLKPANIQVTPGGGVKVLDFGLAKAFEPDAPAVTGETSLSPTVTSAGTMAGVILGTAAYMSPEQARGRALDKRTDIWSFGVVLFECLTGKALFKGESVPDSMGAILHKDPDWTRLPDETPERIRELLIRCLDKDARKRLRDIGDARLELEVALGLERSAISGSVVPAPTGRQKSPSPLAALALAAVAGALLAGAGVWMALSGRPAATPAARQVMRLAVGIPPDRVATDLVISPDGLSVAYLADPRQEGADARRRYYLRHLDNYQTREVAGSEDAYGLQFSPDSRWITFVAPLSDRATSFRLMRVPVDGSAPPQAVVDMDRSWMSYSWLTSDELVVATHGPQSILRIAASDGRPGAPLEVKAQDFEGEVFLESPLPDGRHILGSSAAWSDRGWSRRVVLLDAESGEAHLLVEDAYNPRWSSSGHLLFSRQDTLLAAQFDPGVSRQVGNTVALAGGLLTLGEWSGGSFDVSATGSLAYFPGGVVGGRRELAILAADDTLTPWPGEKRAYVSGLRVSPDGQRFSVTMANPNGLYEVWISEIERPLLRRFAAEPGRDCHQAIWSHDSRKLAYLSVGQESDGGVYVRDMQGGEARMVLPREEPSVWIHPTSFTADGRHLLIDLHGPEDKILAVDLDKPDAPPGTLVAQGSAGTVSWDGRWLSYTSDTTGRTEVYLRRLAPDLSTGPEIPVTAVGAQYGFWMKGTDDLQMSYVSNDQLYTLTLDPATGRVLDDPELFAVEEALDVRIRSADWLHGKDRLLLLRGTDEEPPREIHVVLNWMKELESRAGTHGSSSR